MTLPVNKACEIQGYLLIDKPLGKTAFHLVAVLRKRLGIRKIGHAGTLDPLATGVMVMLIGKYTKLSDKFINQHKEYLAKLHLGIETDSYDAEGQITAKSDLMPSLQQLEEAIANFQGDTLQIPPMFSAKKINGQKLYTLARRGEAIERPAVNVNMEIQLINYCYPSVELKVKCTKGTYIRSLAYDLGKVLNCGAHLSGLIRTKSGPFELSNCLSAAQLYDKDVDLKPFIQHVHI